MKKFIYFLLFFLLCILVLVIINTPVGTFDKLVLSNYTQKNEETIFDEVTIHKDNLRDESLVYEENDIKKVNEILDIFRNQKLIQLNRGFPSDALDISEFYWIDFKNNDTYEELNIIISNSKYMRVSTLTFSVDEKNRITTTDSKTKKYKIISEGVDIKLLEELVK